MVRRTTANLSSVKRHIAKLEKLHGHGPLREAERWCLLRVFFALHEKELTNSNQNGVNSCLKPAIETSRFPGRGRAIVERVVKTWNQASRSEINNGSD